MPDTKKPWQSDVSDLDALADVENDIGWSRDHFRSLAFLLVGFAIVVALISLGLLLG